jgi:hypothetical protein
VEGWEVFVSAESSLRWEVENCQNHVNSCGRDVWLGPVANIHLSHMGRATLAEPVRLKTMSTIIVHKLIKRT